MAKIFHCTICYIDLPIFQRRSHYYEQYGRKHQNNLGLEIYKKHFNRNDYIMNSKTRKNILVRCHLSTELTIISRVAARKKKGLTVTIVPSLTKRMIAFSSP